MARRTNRLSARSVVSLKSKGVFADGQGLYLRVGTSGAQSWTFI